jgi:hypothetical protein
VCVVLVVCVCVCVCVCIVIRVCGGVCVNECRAEFNCQDAVTRHECVSYWCVCVCVCVCMHIPTFSTHSVTNPCVVLLVVVDVV